MSLPTKEQFEELKQKRKQEMELKRILERQVSEAGDAGSTSTEASKAPRRSGEVAVKSEPLTRSGLCFPSVLASCILEIKVTVFLPRSYFSFGGSAEFLLSRIPWRLAVLPPVQAADDPDTREFLEHFGTCSIKQRIICVFKIV